jgi:hypothetical protein
MSLTKIRGNTQILDGTITENQLSSSVAGNGLIGGAGSPISVGTGNGIIVNANNIEVNQGYNFTLTHPTAPITISNSAARITYASAPTFTNADSLALVTKAYVDATAQGLNVKESVRVATEAPYTLATDFEAGDTVDGVVLAAGDRILIKDQVSAIENGIYIVQASGAPTRALDMDQNSEFAGSFVFVKEGATNQDTGWVCTTDDPVNLGVTPITFVQFSSAGIITASTGLTKVVNDIQIDPSAAGNGLTFTAGVLAVGGTSGRISVSANAVDIDSGYIGQSSINTVGTLTSGSTGAGFTIDIASSTVSGTLGVINGGTGATSLTTNGILYGNGTAPVGITASAINSTLVTDGSGVPSLSNTLPNAVQDNITRTGILVSGATGAGFTVALGTSNVTGTINEQIIVGGISGTPVKTLFKAFQIATSGTSITITGLNSGTLYKVYRNGILEIAGLSNYTATTNTLTNTVDPFIAGEEIFVEQIQTV